jgi:hypothetical protein
MFTCNKKILFGLLTAVVLAGGVYISWVQSQAGDRPADKQAQANNSVRWGEGKISLEGDVSNSAGVTSSSASSRSETGSQFSFASPKTFTHETLRFSFQYPQKLQVGRFDQGGTEIIVVQNPNEQVGFQISIRSIDEQIAMTKERIQEDLPDLQVRQPQPVQLGADAGQGLAFYSDNEAFDGSSREVWFTFDNHLYQISTYANLDPLLKQVLNSWSFQ